MKKYLLVITLLIIGVTAGAQGMEFRLRAGANFQNSKLDGKEYSFLPHFGASAGIRLSTIGIYGEVLYSQHEDINGSQAINYIIPSLQIRLYTFRYMYAELGLCYMVLADEIEGGLIDNVDKEAGYYVGFGASFKKIEVGLRTANLPVTNIQLTASYRF